eukprot:CAMPEP_0194030122 /NCGR_PEP_ID=MMETSP0009_2-20130614/3717_1 /TAXON_ID=210454 /ORGANISM="Grammatophora oceanica, Strain CCMP 410" /LENGTH=138 /DNA_ID=CAMNT_0038670011 /DNA_START=95 /DNA_END=511 /DNA_ORIENTATION=-
MRSSVILALVVTSSQMMCGDSFTISSAPPPSTHPSRTSSSRGGTQARNPVAALQLTAQDSLEDQQQLQQKQLSWLDLPKSSLLNLEQDKSSYVKNLPSAELIIGRVAMIGAISLMIGEFTTGASIVEQFTDAMEKVLN